MEARQRDPVFRPGYRVYTVQEPERSGQRGLPPARFAARTSRVVVGGGRVLASDRQGWVGLQWRTLADRLVKAGAIIGEVTRGGGGAQDAEDDGTQEAAPPVPE